MPSAPIFHKSPALRPGEPVGVIAPAGPFDRDCFEAGLAALAQRYEVRFDPGIFSRYRYLAGDDARRLAELNGALADQSLRAIFCARGGYGALRLLRGIVAPARAGKPLIGFSDITALHQWEQSRGRISIHGPVLTQLARQPQHTRQRLFNLLESDTPAAPLVGTNTWVPGSAEGPLLGGNLSVWSRLIGTPFMPELEGAILLLEDVGERPYRLDRMWTHLELAGVFRKIRGLVLGSFSGCEERDADYGADQVLGDLAARASLPCAGGFAIGHGEVNEPVPLGARVRLDADSCRLTFLEPAVSAHASHAQQRTESQPNTPAQSG